MKKVLLASGIIAFAGVSTLGTGNSFFSTVYADDETGCRGTIDKTECSVFQQHQRHVDGNPASIRVDNPNLNREPQQRPGSDGASNEEREPYSRRECRRKNSTPPEKAKDDVSQEFTSKLLADFERFIDAGSAGRSVNTSRHDSQYANPDLEYGALIVRIGNTTETLARVEGGAREIDLALLNQTLIGSGYSFVHIVGLVHYHPPEESSSAAYNRSTDVINYAPSNGDIQVGKWLASLVEDLGAMSAENFEARFTHYIIGPYGKLRQYDQNAKPDFLTGNLGDDEVDTIEKKFDIYEDDANGNC